MRVIICGTGNYYQKYKTYLQQEDVLFFIDNDERKHGLLLDGKEIRSFTALNTAEYDLVIILIMKHHSVLEQLQKQGVERRKIKVYSELGDCTEKLLEVNTKGKRILLNEWCEQKREKRILVLSHEFSRTGVPVAMMKLSELLRDMGYNVLLGSLCEGTLQQELEEKEIDYMNSIEGIYTSERFARALKVFELIVVGTLVLSRVGTEIIKSGKMVVWWLHESLQKMYEEHALPVGYSNVAFYGVGQRVLKVFKHMYPHSKIEQLCYYLPEVNSEKLVREKICFAMIGSVLIRKGQDILIQAIRGIGQELLKRVEFLFVGKEMQELSIDWEGLSFEIPQIRYLGEVSQKEMNKLYREIDVLVCPSRDDPMPIVVTQAMQNAIPCIVSTEVGQQEYIIDGVNGFVFESENVDSLRQKIILNIVDRELSIACGKRGKTIFDAYFSENAFRKELQNILKLAKL